MANKIKIGGTYTLRNGLKTSPIKLVNNGTNYRFEAEVLEPGYKEPSILAWLANGKYLTNDIEHEKDILIEDQ